MSQIITVTFAEGQREAIAAQPLEQWAYGQTLQFEGLDLPQAYRVDFSNFEYCGASIPRVGGPDGVAVPVEVLTSGRNVYAFIWIQDETSGARYRRATVRVVPGPEPDTDESPEEQSAVTEAINALNAAAEAIPEQVNAAVEEAISGGNFSGVFWATYGETTSAEVAAAVADAKLVATKRGGLIYILTHYYSLGGVVFYRFACLRDKFYGVLELANDRWIIVSNNIPIPPVESPAFTGVPTAPTAPAGTNSDQLATTAFVQAAIEDIPAPGQTISEELKRALLQLAEHVAYIDDQGEAYYQDLYDALYPPAVLATIEAVFVQGSTVVYDVDTLDSLKPMLTVTAIYDDGSTRVLSGSEYTLSGTLTAGISTITAAYGGKTDGFEVNVTAAPSVYSVTNNLTGCTTDNSATSVVEGSAYAARITASTGYTLVGAAVTITVGGQDITSSAYSGGVISIPAVTGALVISVAAVEIVLSSISAVYTQSGTVYDTDTLDSLKADLVVTAVYTDSSTQTVAAADYTLSGTLTEGTSTITVSYGGKTTTFSVTVTHYAVQTNYVEVGTPTIENGILTVTDGNFIKTPEAFSPGANTWKIRVKYKHNAPMPDGYQDIFGGVNDSNLSVRTLLIESSYYGLRPIAFLSSNNSTWNISSTFGAEVSGIPNYTVTNWLWLELSYDGNKYHFEYSFDGNTFTGWELTSAAHVYDGFAIAYGLKRNGILNNGQIDLSECKIWIDDQLWWQAIG